MVEKRVPFFHLFISGAMIMKQLWYWSHEHLNDVIGHYCGDSYDADESINEAKLAYAQEQLLTRRLRTRFVKRLRERRWRAAWSDLIDWADMHRYLYKTRRMLPRAIKELNGWYEANEPANRM